MTTSGRHHWNHRKRTSVQLQSIHRHFLMRASYFDVEEFGPRVLHTVRTGVNRHKRWDTSTPSNIHETCLLQMLRNM